MKGSKIFQQNRALGYVSNQVPATVRYLFGRKENLITTCVGRSFQTYSSNHFRLLCVSGLHPEDITCLASNKFLTFSACGNSIYAWRGGSIIKYKYTGHEAKVHLLLPFGAHLISVDEESLLKIWDIKSEELYLEIPFQNDNFKITAIMHPDTYVNKILIGSEQGSLQLWNIRQGKLVHTFNGFSHKITVLEQSPALDVVGVGLSNGKISLLNLKVDEILMEFNQDWGPVTGLSFRTDGPPVMISSSVNGQIALWNLEERKIVGTLSAHCDSVVSLKCLPSEPIFLSTSTDNSMKLWIFDKPDGGPRLLRYREGHSAPPLCVRFHGANGVHILSAGEDSSLRVFSTISESLNQSLGRASYNRKSSKKKNQMEEDPLIMPPIIDFTSETTREKEWDSIAAIHSNLVQVTTWSYDKKKMGELKLVPPQFQNKNCKDFRAVASCLNLTHCGNFVIIGYSSGHVERFNIQSGLHRASYGSPAHKEDVRGVFSDNLNQIVVTGSMDNFIRFWNFKNEVSSPIGFIKMSDAIIMFRGHRDSSMLGVVLEDFTVNLIDCDTKTIIRKFAGHSAAITDVCFSPDSRWLMTASMDCTIKTWDIPSSYMVDQFRMPQPCISMTMSPNGDFLATAHVDFLGVYLWANKTLFENIQLRSIDPLSEAPLLELPSLAYFESLENQVASLDLKDENEDGELIKMDYHTPDQLASDLITMSSLAESKWKNLLNLDIIKKRNKPKEALKKPKQAPFFLPTVAGLDLKFNINDMENSQDDSKIVRTNLMENLTLFGSTLKKSRNLGNFEDSIKHITSLNPSGIDFEIKSLGPLNGGSAELMKDFLKMIVEMFQSNLYFELTQSYFALFLKIHEKTIVQEDGLGELLENVEAAQSSCWEKIEQNLLYGIGVVTNLRNFC